MTFGLGRRVAFTVVALLVYCVGTYAPVPGVYPAMWEQLFREQGPLWQTHFWMY